MDNNDRKIFWDSLCSLDGKDIAADSLKLNAAIKYPNTICRYRSVTMSTIAALQTNSLYFSSSFHYDDPFDTFLNINWEYIESQTLSRDLTLSSEYDKFISTCKQFGIPTEKYTFDSFKALKNEDLLRLTRDNFTKVIRPHFKKHLYSICFAEDPLNENLWLKYANNHTGFCLEYSLKDDTKFSFESFQSGISLYPVYYSNDRYDATNYVICLSVYYLLDLIDKPMAQRFKLDMPMHWEPEKVSLIKHKCHEYDAEWRIISHSSERSSVNWIPTSLYIGLRTGEVERKLIVRAAVAAGIKKIYNVIISPTDKLTIEALSEEDKIELLK